MEYVYNFLSRLALNNNRDWFEAHKDEYHSAKEIFDDFTRQLIKEISRWDPYISRRRLTPEDCTYRIYRDIRFSPDKTPYKTHMACYIVRGGKNSPYPGYYFHMEPPEGSYFGGNMLFAGLYNPTPQIIASVRDEISVNGDALVEALNKAKGFVLQFSKARKRVPVEYEKVADEGWRNLIRLREITMLSNMSEEFLFAPGSLAKRVSQRLRYCLDLNKFLYRCVDYALEGNK